MSGEVPAVLAPELRGIFGEKGDSMNWLDAVSRYPNGVPRFESRAECLEFMKEYNTYNGGSNPSNPHLMHIFTMLTNWNEIEKTLLPAIRKARQEPTFASKLDRDTYLSKEGRENSANVYEQSDAVFEDVSYRLNIPIHRCTTAMSTMNTLKYLFFHMKCGIFVMIRNRKLRIFAPFVNSDYRNTWGDKLTLEGDGTIDSYYTQKSGQYREEQVEPDKSKWWANGNIICNELSKDDDKEKMQYWGDHFLAPLRDMLGEACRLRQIPDCEFFLNKRDYPQLKINIPQGGIPVEPYGFIFDKDDRDPDQDVELAPQHKFETYAPIVSFYAAQKHRFSDIPWPSSEDWEGACGLVFPQTFMHSKDKDGKAQFDSNPRDLFTEANFRKFQRGWDEDRVATAFFRGTATGGGTTIHNNQRLMCAHLSHLWKDDPEKGGDEPFLDAAIVGWNLRDKKIADSPMTFLRKTSFDFTAGKHHFTPIYEQSKYKYLVYIDGHCAACRYAFMMRLGSVILKVEPRQVADTMWYFQLLEPFVDHVPVKPDLSDLEDKLRWCRQNDDKCRQIAQNCMNLYQKYIAREPLLDYVEMVCKQISCRYQSPPAWWDEPPAEQKPPKLRKPDTPCSSEHNGNSRLCVRCQQQADADAAAEEKLKAEKKNLVRTKQKLRDRMRKRAKVSTTKSKK